MKYFHTEIVSRTSSGWLLTGTAGRVAPPSTRVLQMLCDVMAGP